MPCGMILATREGSGCAGIRYCYEFWMGDESASKMEKDKEVTREAACIQKTKRASPPCSRQEIHPETPRVNTFPVPIRSPILAYPLVSCPVLPPPFSPVFVSGSLSGSYLPFM